MNNSEAIQFLKALSLEVVTIKPYIYTGCDYARALNHAIGMLEVDDGDLISRKQAVEDLGALENREVRYSDYAFVQGVRKSTDLIRELPAVSNRRKS